VAKPRRRRTSEKAIQNDILIAVSALPSTMVWRNNTGMAWQGEPMKAQPGALVRVEPGMKILRNARPIEFGLEGSGDILGACNGRPLAIEVKDSEGYQSEQQKTFERVWTAAGGIYVLARSPEAAVAELAYYATDPLG
jgi:hypothetical protein